MLLRRITQHVKEQNWFAVGIDFVIVIVGVFIGIQVANWNEGRSLAAQERQVLQAISEDLRADITNLKNGISMAQINLSASHYLLGQAGFDSFKKLKLPIVNTTMLTGLTLDAPVYIGVDETQKTEIWKHITIHYYPIQSDAALDALIAAGNLGIITDTALVHDLQEYRLLWLAMSESNNSTFRPFRDRTIFVGQRFGLSPFVSLNVDELVALVKQNPELRGAIRTLAEFTLLHHNSIENVLKQVESLKVRIDEKLASDH